MPLATIKRQEGDITIEYYYNEGDFAERHGIEGVQFHEGIRRKQHVPSR